MASPKSSSATSVRLGGVRVISRTSAFAFKAKASRSRRSAGDCASAPFSKAACESRQPGTRHGAARRCRGRLPALVQAVRPRVVDVFAIQDQIAASIVSELQTGLAGFAVPGAPRRRGPRYGTWGMYALNKWTDDSMRRAITDFRTAIAQMPRSPRHTPPSQRGRSGRDSGLGVLPARETIPQARWAVEKALELDPTLVDAHKVRGLIAMNH